MYKWLCQSIIVIGLMCVLTFGWCTPMSTDRSLLVQSKLASPVLVDGKRFVQDGHEIILNGINYFPAYSPAIYPSIWLNAKQYRPNVVDNDLLVIQKLGINLVSVQWITRAEAVSLQDCTNIRDFLDRAQVHGLLVNFFIGTGGIVPFVNPKLIAAVPKTCALTGHLALFAYDIAWEPRFGDESKRLKLQQAASMRSNRESRSTSSNDNPVVKSSA